jgi:hypothetical protein
MKLVLIFLIPVVALLNEANGIDAYAEMFLAGTNDLIGTISFIEEEDTWGVVISGSVHRLRPMATLVSLLFTSIISTIL